MVIEIKDSVPQQIKSDEKRFKQILFNLLGNAVKFTFSGSITVQVDYTPKLEGKGRESSRWSFST
jgi:signal transduction histidine kinase